jgi:hypothetical protein
MGHWGNRKCRAARCVKPRTLGRDPWRGMFMTCTTPSSFLCITSLSVCLDGPWRARHGWVSPGQRKLGACVGASERRSSGQARFVAMTWS